MRNLIATILLICSTAVIATAQGFPWQDFKPRSLQEIVKIDSKEIDESVHRDSLILHGDPLFSVTRVNYIGKSRPISSVKEDLLRSWAKVAGQTDDYVNNYKSDYLFTESGVEYWLPVQTKVSSYFPKELKQGDELDIYIVRVGGVCKKRECDWLFLVEEYQKPKDLVKN